MDDRWTYSDTGDAVQIIMKILKERGFLDGNKEAAAALRTDIGDVIDAAIGNRADELSWS